MPAIGTLLPLGFGMGPGIAYSIGQSWSNYGFEEGAMVGLTISAIGFSARVFYRNGGREPWPPAREESRLLTGDASMAREVRTGVIEKSTPLPEAGKLQFLGGAPLNPSPFILDSLELFICSPIW